MAQLNAVMLKHKLGPDIPRLYSELRSVKYEPFPVPPLVKPRQLEFDIGYLESLAYAQ